MSASTVTVSGLPGRFHDLRKLASSAHAEVFAAYDRDTHGEVALKILRAVGTHAETARTMFRREVAALEGLEHPAIVKILGTFEGTDGALGIVLDLVPRGQTLATLFDHQRTRRQRSRPLVWRIDAAMRLADAISAAHRRDIVHRDIKPSNVLWNEDDDTLLLADFGIAAVLRLTAAGTAGQTLRNYYSAPWAAPEQLAQKAPTFASDVHAFALLVASLLVQAMPADDFEPAQLDAFLAPVLAEITRLDGAAELMALLHASLGEAARRPSITELHHALSRIAAQLAPRPVAGITLTKKAREVLADFDWLDDLDDLRIQPDGDRIKARGKTVWLDIVCEDPDRPGRVINAGFDAGPRHESHRRSSAPCVVQLVERIVPSAPLVEAAAALRVSIGARATEVLLERARKLIDIERERLPVFVLTAEVLGGTPVEERRDERVGQAAGYEGAFIAEVDVRHGFALALRDVQIMPRALAKNVVRQQLEADGVALDAPMVHDGWDDWYELFNDGARVELLDEAEHVIGEIQLDGPTVRVVCGGRRRLPQVGRFIVKDRLTMRQLNAQRRALELVSRGEAARADLGRLLGSGAHHRSGERPLIDLLQKLRPAAEMQDLVETILASESIFALQGPPGTGKTTMIAEVVAQLLRARPDQRILICSQSNDAVANALEGVRGLRTKLEADWIIVRDVRAERAKQEGEWAGFEAAYAEFAGRVIGDAPTDLPVGEQAIVGEWLDAVAHRTHGVDRDYRRLVQVWGTTTACSPRPSDDVGAPYDFVIIDEAAKATVGEVMVPLVRARRVLVVGDHKQLPAYIDQQTIDALKEANISEDDARRSLFEHLHPLLPETHRAMLDVQYRMHPSIGDLVSRLFYEGKLKNGTPASERALPVELARDERVWWLDVVGTEDAVGKSRANDAEIEVIMRMLEHLDRAARPTGERLSVAIIAAYKAQAERLDERLRRSTRKWDGLGDVRAATVDSFQGRQADVVLYSLTRTGEAERKFLANTRRFNVALSRARRLLVMVGDRRGALGTPILKELLDLIPAANQLDAEAFLGPARQAPPRPRKGDRR